MAVFEEAWKLTKANEGGYSNEPEDDGNWTGGKQGVGVLAGTNWGITAYEIKDFIGRVPTVEDVKAFPETSAMAIYKKKYWDKIQGDRIENQTNANTIFDNAVNMGVVQAIKIAQRSIADVDSRVKETGVMDEITLTCLNEL